jgi:hypothetical protein
MSMKSGRPATTRIRSAGAQGHAPRPRIQFAGRKAPRKEARSGMVAKLQFTCETMGRLVTYELPSDATTVKDLWSRRLMLNCPHCGHVHGFAFRPAFIRSVLEIRGPGAMRVSEQTARK